MKKYVNSFIFADQYEKPRDVTKYRPISEGGLGMHNIECKSDAMLCKTFMELACSKKFQGSSLFNAIYKFHILDDQSFPDPGILRAYE